jgi:hypothetical protein
MSNACLFSSPSVRASLDQGLLLEDIFMMPKKEL